MKEYKGIIVNILNRRQFKGKIIVDENLIFSIEECDHDFDQFILPGLIDAHVHIESSMTVPSSFARMVVSRGTVAVVSDPHEIANVMGEKGIDFMIENAQKTPLKIYFGVPSCVPATPFESAGSILDSEIVKRMIARDDMFFLSEMMNFPGVINEDREVMGKINAAKKNKKVIDGHAPGLRGENLKKYVQAGISTDHECFSYEEAIDKIKLGMKILIREGSAAKNFDALFRLIDEYPNDVMLCTDDSHPDTLLEEGHIDKMIRKGLKNGLSIYNLLQTSSVNPARHYGLDIGLLQKNDSADFIIVDNLNDFNVTETVIGGKTVFKNNEIFIDSFFSSPVNVFKAEKIKLSDLVLKPESEKIRVITVEDGELITGQKIVQAKIKDENVISDLENDILKMLVLNRYQVEKPQIGFIQNIGLQRGAIASSIAHDSHNIIAVGASDEDILAVVNRLIENKGGIVVGDSSEQLSLELEIAGLMTQKNGEEVAAIYKQMIAKTIEFGSELKSPFMTLAFMSLLVIPELKLGDKGLFDVNSFNFIDLFVKE